MKLIFLRIFSVICFTMVLGLNISSAQCTNATPYITNNVPTTNVPLTLLTCAFAGEYTTLNNVVVGTTLSIVSTIGTDFLTVRSGTPAGPVVTFGTSP